MDVETDGVDASSYAPCEDSGSFLVDEERQLERLWSDAHRLKNMQLLQSFEGTIVDLRKRIEEVRVRCDTIWDHFVSLALEKIMKQHLRSFLTEVQKNINTLSPETASLANGISECTSAIVAQRRTLDGQAGVLEAMAHRRSIQNHLSMMLSRVASLEAYLLGKARMQESSDNLTPKRRETNVPSDLLYLSVRLRTTRCAVTASRKSREIAASTTELLEALRQAEGLKAELAVVATRIGCLRDQADYWMAFLDMPDNPSWTDPSSSTNAGGDCGDDSVPTNSVHDNIGR